MYNRSDARTSGAIDTAPESCAKLVMLLLLNCDQSQRAQGKTDRAPDPMAQIRDRMAGKTLGIVGFDASGQDLARRASHIPEIEIVIHHSTALARATLSGFKARQVDRLETLLAERDFVSLHCATTDCSGPVITSARLDLMKEDAYLINAAQSSLIDPLALANALIFGTIGGAAVAVSSPGAYLGHIGSACDNLVVWPRGMDISRKLERYGRATPTDAPRVA